LRARNSTLSTLLMITSLCGAGRFPFFRTNKALKFFQVDVLHPAKESCVSAFRIGIATMLQGKTSLESFGSKLEGNRDQGRGVL
jgi:hypothetical protein